MYIRVFPHFKCGRENFFKNNLYFKCSIDTLMIPYTRHPPFMIVIDDGYWVLLSISGANIFFVILLADDGDGYHRLELLRGTGSV